MRTVKLYGELAEFTGRKEIVADIADVSESIRMLVANFAGLDRHMAEREYVVCVGDTSIGLDEVKDPIGKEDILITPVIAGAGNVGRIILGAALIGLALTTGGASLGLSGFAAEAGVATWAAGGAGWAMAGNIGLLLVLSGVAGLLTPVPKTPKSEEDPQNSFSFSGIQQTSRAGTPVPVCYGEILTGSVVISAEIDVSEQAT